MSKAPGDTPISPERLAELRAIFALCVVGPSEPATDEEIVAVIDELITARRELQALRARDGESMEKELAGAVVVFERGCYCLAEMMKAYERRIRSDCHSQEDLDKRPWECAEWIAASEYLRKVWPPDAALAAAEKGKVLVAREDIQALALYERTAKAHGFVNAPPWEQLHDDTRQLYREEAKRKAAEKGKVP